MTVKINLIQKSFYISFLFILVIIASLYIEIPYNTIIVSALSSMVLILGIIQMMEIIRTKKLLVKTSEILSQGNERNFSALREKGNSIIDYKITNLIEQLEDSVKQSDRILKDREKLSIVVEQKDILLEDIQNKLNSEVVSIKNEIVNTVTSIDKMIGDFSRLQQSWDTEDSLLKDLINIYSSYENRYGELNSSIEKSKNISEREIVRSEEVMNTISGLYRRTEENDVQMQTIFKGIDNIRDVTDIMSEVADKASILSLNAAIESAHAGEAGKGFAVVAEEVGVLATSTSEHSENINEALYAVSDMIKETSHTEELGTESYPDLIDDVKTINRSLTAIRDLLNTFSLLKKPESIDIENTRQIDRSILTNCIKTLRLMKSEMDQSLDKIAMLPLLPTSPVSASGNKADSKLIVHETSLKPVKDESPIDIE